MKQAMPPVTPKTGYLVTTMAGDFTLNQAVLTNLYQPLLSPLAYVLENVLAAQLQVHPSLADRRLHSQLLTLLNTGAGKLEAARDQLEAVGLLKTFFQEDAVGTVFVYQLQSLLSGQDFFEEDLLSTKLLQVVGEQRFQQLAAQLKRYYYDPAKLTEITHGFFDVFNPDRTSLTADQQLTDKVKATLPTSSHQEELLPADGFDFALLAKQLVGDGLMEDDLQANRQLIISQHLMYGIEELQMRQLVLQAVDWGTSNRIDPRQLKLVVAGQFENTTKVGQEQPQAATTEKLTGLSTQEKQLVKVASDLAPVTFLATLKQQTGGGFVTSNEKYIISNLLNQGLAPEVINILSYDVIVQQDLPTLRKNLVDTIANSWQRGHIRTASEALQEIKNFNKPRPGKKSKGGKVYRHRRGRVKEQLPDWAQAGQSEKKKTKASAAQLRESQQLLAKLKQKHDNQKK
ncbi:DnaD domain protein [uncultured Limosilactobacillus sp.]|uniref:replication initiation and membrane attachment family protein n=1 Tax=uncultured Limosilactobacillus sp. TaxID=2837629 RepID=UPI0025D5B01A|nr:DnaD domain protein [uncultured Limosilactobacillus sp.]